MNGYTTMLASDVLERDGLGLELYSPDRTLIAEVFRDDDTGVRVFNSFMPLSLSPDLLMWFLGQAADKL